MQSWKQILKAFQITKAQIQMVCRGSGGEGGLLDYNPTGLQGPSQCLQMAKLV